MKRFRYFIIILFVFILGISILIKPAILFLVRKQIEDVFPAAAVSIGGMSIKPFYRLSLLDIKINKHPVYDFKIKEAGIAYGIFSLLGGKIRKFYIKGTDISVNLAQKDFSEFNRYLNLKPGGGFLIGLLELSGLSLQVKSGDLELNALLSAELEPLNRLIHNCNLNIYFLDFKGFHLQDAFLRVRQAPYAGELSIGLARYDKLKVKEIKSKAILEGSRLRLDSLGAYFLDGEIRGNLDLEIGKNPQYLLNLKFLDCAIGAFVKDFNLQEKFTASGSLSGTLTLKGSGPDVNILSGDFSAVRPGGVLTITDTVFLERIARNSSQSLDLLVESFKNYRYNNGIMKLSLDKDNLILEIALDSQAGKRDLAVTIHNFELWRVK